jgi:ABC-type polysaccharide/polyol phosphate export permease
LILGFVWSVLWKVQPGDLLPHLTTSIVIWQFMSSVITEATEVFPSQRHLLLSQRVVCSTVIYALVYKNLLILAHNAVIVAVVFVIFQTPITSQIILLIPALALAAITAVWLSYAVGILCARFRDLAHAMQSILQLAFYVTPIIWKPEFLTLDYRWMLILNPFASFITIIRTSVIGGPVPILEWQLATLITFGGLALTLPLIGTFRRRLIFWI